MPAFCTASTIGLDESSNSGGSPLFVSCKPGVLNADELGELRAAWAINSVQKNTARPVDWMENETPALWEIDGELVRYAWYNEFGAETFRGK